MVTSGAADILQTADGQGRSKMKALNYLWIRYATPTNRKIAYVLFILAAFAAAGGAPGGTGGVGH
jgi:hypothetical protein